MFAKIELLQDVTIGGIQQHYVIRKVVGHQQLVWVGALPRDDGKATGIWDCSSGGRMAKSVRHALATGNLLRRGLLKTFLSKPAFMKAIKRDADRESGV